MGIGRLSQQKDFATLIKAFAIVSTTRQLRLVILGDGADRLGLEKLVAELAIQDRVLLPGFQTNPYAWLSRAAVFVLSSRWEGSPNVLTEALALGVPSVAAACPSGPDEVLQQGTYGPLVPVGDVAAMAEAINSVLDKPLPPSYLQQAVVEYTPQASARGYLQALGLASAQHLQSTNAAPSVMTSSRSICAE